jgi:hypothetical protein
VPSASAVLKVDFSFCFSQKSLRLKVYSLGTGTREGTHINPNKEDEKLSALEGFEQVKKQKSKTAPPIQSVDPPNSIRMLTLYFVSTRF